MTAPNACIPFFEEGKNPTVKASAAITGKTFVKISGNRTAGPGLSTSYDPVAYQAATADAGGKALGVAAYDIASAAFGEIITGGIVPVTADGSIAAFDQVIVGATGKAKKLAAAVAATLATGVVGSNNAITWTGRKGGTADNSTTVTLVDPAANSQTLAVDVDGNDIIVSLATNGGGTITSTATLVMAAILEHDAASQLVTTASTSTSTGAGVVAAVAKTNLAGGAAAGAGGFAVGVCMTAASDGDDAEIKLY